jgi:alanine racemase
MCRVVGTVSMDLCMIDVTGVGDAVRIGTDVSFIGPKTTCWDWAKHLGTVPYEITCLIGARVPRVYYKNGQVHDVYYP